MTPLQQAVFDLRRQLNFTQQELAEAVGVTSVTVCRWETSRSPTGWSLAVLTEFAHRVKADKIAEIFEQALNGAHLQFLPRGELQHRLMEIIERLDRIEAKLK